MNTAQRLRFGELHARATGLAQPFDRGNLDAFDDECNRIIGVMQELRQDLVEQIAANPEPASLAVMLSTGRLPVLVGGESPSD